MAKNIPIWPGSSFSESLASGGGTPFALYDTDGAFTSSADKTPDWPTELLEIYAV